MWSGGLGVRSVSKLASSAVLASAAGTLTLQAQILRNTLAADEDNCTSLSHWLSLSGLSVSDSLPIGNQRVLDSAVVAHTISHYLTIKILNTTEHDFWPLQQPTVATGFTRCLL